MPGALAGSSVVADDEIDQRVVDDVELRRRVAINTDWSQAKDLAKEHPKKLYELQRLWLIEAVKYNVLPLDDRFAERANPDIAGRPQLIVGNDNCCSA